MVSREDILGERDRRDVGVEGMDEEEKEKLEGKGSLKWVADSEGEELLVRRTEFGVPARLVGCEF